MWDFINDYILSTFLIILLIMFLVIGLVLCFGMIATLFRDDIFKQSDYIQNIETKLNIYEQEYDNFVLEDSLKQ